MLKDGGLFTAVLPVLVCGSTSLARPKSRIFACPSDVIMMLSGFRSR